MKTISRLSRAMLLFVIVIFSLVLMNAMSIIMLARMSRKKENNLHPGGYMLAGYER